jgi:hypothetical protein
MVLEEEAMNRFSIYKLPVMDVVTNDEAPRRLPRGAPPLKLFVGRFNPAVRSPRKQDRHLRLFLRHLSES